MRTLLIALLTLALSGPALAHRQPEVEVTVEVAEDETSEVMHVTHRLHAHDALRALRVMGEARPSLEEPEQKARLALYVAENLRLTGDAETEIVGAETEGNYLFVYLVHPEVAGVLSSTVLSEVAPAWSNMVHLREGGETVRSVTFTADRPQLDEPIAPAALASPQASEAASEPVRDFVETH